jgi:hypothetical protein
LIHQLHKNIYIYKLHGGVNSYEFSSYFMRYLTFRIRIPNDIAKSKNGKSLSDGLEGKIIIKTWKELPNKFYGCKLGEYLLRPASFSGIIMIDKSAGAEKIEKAYHKMLTYFKNRSTLLLNKLHNTHGRIFWNNSFEEISIDNFDKFNEVLTMLNR